MHENKHLILHFVSIIINKKSSRETFNATKNINYSHSTYLFIYTEKYQRTVDLNMNINEIFNKLCR